MKKSRTQAKADKREEATAASADRFRVWYRVIAEDLRARTGVGIDDFPAYSFRTAWARQLLPGQVVEEIMSSRYIVVPEKRRRRRRTTATDEKSE